MGQTPINKIHKFHILPVIIICICCCFSVAAYAPSPQISKEIKQNDYQEYLQMRCDVVQNEPADTAIKAHVEPVQDKIEEVSKPTEGEKWMNVRVTAYDLSVDSCNKKPTHPQYGISRSGYSLKGHSRESAMSIATDPKIIPLGSTVKIEFINEEYQKYNGVYVSRDVGGAIKGQKIDLFLGDFKSEKTDQSVMDFGITDAKILIIKEEILNGTDD